MKVPATEATPPCRIENDSVCGYTIPVAVGKVVTVGVALVALTLTKLVAGL